MRKNNGYNYLTEIDGSCNEKTFGQIAESGVDVFIVGTSGLFSLHEDVSRVGQNDRDLPAGNCRCITGYFSSNHSVYLNKP